MRLTGSGLGCPTGPQCTDASYVPHNAMGIHAAIEFGNRMVTIAVASVAVVTWLVVMLHRPRRTDLRRLATFAALGLPLQAAIGGISVLTGLNPGLLGVPAAPTLRCDLVPPEVPTAAGRCRFEHGDHTCLADLRRLGGRPTIPAWHALSPEMGRLVNHRMSRTAQRSAVGARRQ